MQIGSILAIYFLFFVLAAFVLLPFGVKTDEEAGTAKVPGQADSAPYRFDLKRHLVKSAVVGVVLTALYIANYSYGWIEVSDLDFYH